MTRPTEFFLRRSSDESIQKRISYDESKLKATTLRPPETEVKASSLPRGAKIGGLHEVDGWKGSEKTVSRGEDIRDKESRVCINWNVWEF